MKQTHCCLKISPRETDFILGSNSPLQMRSNLPSGDWSGHLDFFELQMENGWDTNGCVCFSFQEDFDAQMDLLIASGTISSSFVQWLTANNYMDLGRDGLPHFHSSARYIQIKTGNGFNGNAIQDAWDAARKWGVVPWKDLPFDASVTQAEYLSGVTPAMDAKAAQFLSMLGGKNAIQYHWITQNAPKNLTAMENALVQAPLCFGIAVTSDWNQVNPSDPAPDAPPQHCVMNYDIAGPVCEILDHYTPFEKTLDTGYPVNYAFQGVIIPIIPIATVAINESEQIANEIVSAPISNQQKSSLLNFLSKVVIAIAKVLGFND